MKRVLIIRQSSLGDIVHALPIVSDLQHHCPHSVIDWVAEETFAEVPGLSTGVHRVIPVALRRWRRRPLTAATWRELGVFRRQLRQDHYDVILDLQEQVKGAALAWLARGPAHGPDRESIREPVATVVYRQTHRVDPRQHLIDRCRELAGKAFGYVPAGPPRFDLRPPPLVAPAPGPYAVLLHATSQPGKLWPEDNWRAVIAHVTQAGLFVVLPWGAPAERERSERLADGSDRVIIPPHQGLAEIAALLAGAQFVCGVDTGLVHLAAAVGTPTLALFFGSDRRTCGAARVSASARDLGDYGAMPTSDQVIAEAGVLFRIARQS